MGDIIYRTAQKYAAYIPQVCVGSDWPPHFEADGQETDRWWDAFADSVQNGRPAIFKCPVPVTIPPYPRMRKSGKEYALEKNRKLTRPKPREPRMTFLCKRKLCDLSCIAC